MPRFHIECRRWFQKSYGNTYHSVYIWKGDWSEQIVALPRAYGYGEQCLQTALDWLRAEGLIPNGCERCGKPQSKHNGYEPMPDGHRFSVPYGTRYIREELHSTYSIVDVPRQRDL